MQAFEILAAETETHSASPRAFSRGEAKTSPPRFRKLSIKEYVRLLFPFLVFGIVGAVARLKYPDSWPANDLVYFLANAFMVAMVIGIILALFSARLLIEEVSENLAQRLIGRGLPAELQGSIKDIVNTVFVRDHYVKSYTFSTPENGQVSLDIEIRYEVRNYSDLVRDYAPEITEEISCQPEFRFLEYGIAGKKIHTFSDEELSSKVETVGEINVKRVPKSALPKVSLRSAKGSDKSVCHVTWRYRVTMPEQYCEVTTFGEPTIGATLQLHHAPDGLEFESGGDDSLYHECGSQSWYFDRPFITGQHVRAWWAASNRPFDNTPSRIRD
jgi:hypothetical protein